MEIIGGGEKTVAERNIKIQEKPWNGNIAVVTVQNYYEQNVLLII